jgi:hypothetical protein
MLIIDHKYIFIHIPKTGGTYVTNVLEKLAGYGCIDLQIYSGKEKHAGLSKALKLFHGENSSEPKALASIREPVLHYVSRYNFRWWQSPHFWKQTISLKYPSFPNLTFDEFVDAINDYTVRKTNRTKFLEMCLEHNIGNCSFNIISKLGRRPFKSETPSSILHDLKQRTDQGNLFLLNTKQLTDNLGSFLTKNFQLKKNILENALKEQKLPKADARLNKKLDLKPYIKVNEVSEATYNKIKQKECLIDQLIAHISS